MYGADASKTAISAITLRYLRDHPKVLEGIAEWQNRPLDQVGPEVFVHADHIKVRAMQVANLPLYLTLAATADGKRDLLGLSSGDGGAEVLAV